MSDERLAVIIVSGYCGYSTEEVCKASSFKAYLSEKEHTSDQMRYLTAPEEEDRDGSSTVENVGSAFEWLRNRSGPNSAVTVYISDHAQIIDGEPSFRFEDGNISVGTIDGWLDRVECSSMGIIVNGARSGLAGEGLSDPSREVFCSMKAVQACDPDRFNITRSLMDPWNDLDDDGKVSFGEAFQKEILQLEGSGQDPVEFT